MNRRGRITPLGAVLIGLLVAGVAALLVGSHAVQAIGFIVVLVVVLVLAADKLPRSARGPRD